MRGEGKKKERRHPRFNFCDLKSPIKTSIIEIFLLKQWKYSKEICMDGNNVSKDDENGQLSCGINSSPATAHFSL